MRKTALDVEKFLRAEIGAEARFGDDEVAELEARAVDTIETLAAMPPEAFGDMKRWFQNPRIEALDHAIRYTAETRKGRNSEATANVEKFFSKA